ncbi:MAG TPA: energy transducer TonB [Candidatus Binatia bacterium]
MKLASFFFLSLALHAAALVYPVSFPERKQEQLIPVRILPTGQETTSAGEQGGQSGNRALRDAVKSPRPAALTAQNLVESAQSNRQVPRHQFDEAPTNPIESNSAALEFVPSTSAETDSQAKITSAGRNGNGSDNGGFGGGINGPGSPGTDTWLGSGDGSGGNGAGLIRARYSETPRPAYPESARNEGREGRVLLRVLVDDHGRSKQVEINNSSGSEALDRAAAEAIKRWRFIPARYGDKAVESWIRVPIDFSLADSKSW